MITLLLHLFRVLPLLFGGHRPLALENLALSQHALRMSKLVDVHVIALEGVRGAFGQPVALWTVRRRRDRDPSELVRIETDAVAAYCGLLSSMIADDLL